MYVDKKEFLTRKVEMTSDTQMGPIKTEVIMNEYKEVDNISAACVFYYKAVGHGNRAQSS
jgi:hypothetical protein